jgi:hypothetical protein
MDGKAVENPGIWASSQITLFSRNSRSELLHKVIRNIVCKYSLRKEINRLTEKKNYIINTKKLPHALSHGNCHNIELYALIKS